MLTNVQLCSAKFWKASMPILNPGYVRLFCADLNF